MTILPALLGNYLVNEVYYAFGFAGNFFPALFACVAIGLALRALIEVSAAQYTLAPKAIQRRVTVCAELPELQGCMP